MSLRPVIEDAYRAYVETLEQIPPLLPGVRETLSTLCACRTTPASLATIIFSEGNHPRLERIIAAYNIREQGYFNEIRHRSQDCPGFPACRGHRATLPSCYRKPEGRHGRHRRLA